MKINKVKPTRWAVMFLGVGLGASVLSACSSGSDSTGAAPTKLVVSVADVPDKLDTTSTAGSATAATLLSLEPLIRYNTDNTYGPDLASKYVVSHDGLTYTLTIRKGVKFWDGSPLTPNDVVESLNVHVGAKSASHLASSFTIVKSIEATSPDTVTIALKSRDGSFVGALATAGIFSAKYADEAKGALGNSTKMNMGTGPYEFASFQPNVSVSLKRNPDYWGKKAPYTLLKLEVVPENNLAVGVQSGKLDAVFAAPVSQLKVFKAASGYSVKQTETPQLYMFGMSMNRAPWNDRNLRDAFARVVNRDLIAKSVLNGATPATSLAPRFLFGSSVSASALDAMYTKFDDQTPKFDLVEAKRFLSKSQHPDGLSTTLIVSSADPNLSLIAQTVAQDAKKIGIVIKVQERDDSAYNDSTYFKPEQNQGLTLDGFESDRPEALRIPSLKYKSTLVPAKGGFTNTAAFDSPVVDQLLEQAQGLSPADPKRASLTGELMAKAQSDLPYVPVAFPANALVLKSSLSFPTYNTFWWLSNWPTLLESGKS